MKIQMGGKRHEVFLVDNGTMDTELSVNGIHVTYDAEFASEYRKADGSFSDAGFRRLAKLAVEDYLEEKAMTEE